MAVAAIGMFLPAALLLFAGIATIVWGVRTRRGVAPRSRPAGVLRIIAGIGVLGGAVLALGVFYLDVQYGVILLPVLGLLAAGAWALPFVIAAAIIHRRRDAR